MKAAGEKLIASNPHARSNFFIEKVVEAGLILQGTEVKSLRAQSPNIKESFVEVRNEAWLVGMHIAPYSHGNRWNHDPVRKRKLLLHKHQILELKMDIEKKGLVVIPLRLYFKAGRAKLELGIGKGKKKHDKRHDIQKRDERREMSREMKRSNRKT